MQNPLLFSQHPAWETIGALIDGVSAIDIPTLPLRNLRETEDFLACYGFDWNDTDNRREIETLRQEAIAFVEEELINDEPELAILDEVKQQSDVRQLLRWTSMRQHAPLRQRWSCVLLRVMHTLSHCHSHLNERYRDQIQTQILDRFQPHLFEDKDGLTLGQGPGAVRLSQFQIKASKPVRSLAMKLLQKSENVAADIFDRIGVRFVTHERLDTLFVVDYLRTHHVVMFANVKPSRSRNTLIDLPWLKCELRRLEEEVRAGRLARYERLELLRELVSTRPFPAPPEVSPNAHSSVSYHSIQFTCRQMIRVPSRTTELESMIDALKEGDKASQELAKALLKETGRRSTPTRFFFPFEVQIMDEESYKTSREGLASHDIYKARQRRAVKRRVLSDLLVRPTLNDLGRVSRASTPSGSLLGALRT